MVSAWEIQIKTQLGKLERQVPLEAAIRQQQARNGLRILPVELAHVLAVGTLPRHHNDPFDRLLVAQAQEEDLYLVTADEALSRYGLKICW